MAKKSKNIKDCKIDVSPDSPIKFENYETKDVKDVKLTDQRGMDAAFSRLVALGEVGPKVDNVVPTTEIKEDAEALFESTEAKDVKDVNLTSEKAMDAAFEEVWDIHNNQPIEVLPNHPLQESTGTARIDTPQGAREYFENRFKDLVKDGSKADDILMERLKTYSDEDIDKMLNIKEKVSMAKRISNKDMVELLGAGIKLIESNPQPAGEAGIATSWVVARMRAAIEIMNGRLPLPANFGVNDFTYENN